jgi:hypothetical protein
MAKSGDANIAYSARNNWPLHSHATNITISSSAQLDRGNRTKKMEEQQGTVSRIKIDA